MVDQSWTGNSPKFCKLNQMKTIVILSADCGSGHKQAGNNLKHELTKLFPQLHIEHRSINYFANAVQNFALGRMWMAASTFRILRMVYAYLHSRVVSHDICADLLARSISSIGKKAELFYHSQEVVAVIALHPAAACAAAVWKKSCPFYLCVVATDMIVHSGQTISGVDRIFCDPLSVVRGTRAEELSRSGVIVRVGMPIQPAFFMQAPPRDSSLETNVLVTFGAKGVASNWHLNHLFRLALLETGTRVRIICGSNFLIRRKIEKQIAKLGLSDRVTSYGFERDMSKHVLWADLVVGKLGGLTVAEALASMTPLIAVEILPGQEEYNYEAALRIGMCERALDFSEFYSAFSRLRDRKSVV